MSTCIDALRVSEVKLQVQREEWHKARSCTVGQESMLNGKCGESVACFVTVCTGDSLSNFVQTSLRSWSSGCRAQAKAKDSQCMPQDSRHSRLSARLVT